MTPSSPYNNDFTMTNLREYCFCGNFTVDSLDVALHRDRNTNNIRPIRCKGGSGFIGISYNERKRLDVIERREKLNRHRIADLEWENKRLNQNIRDICRENERLRSAVTRMQIQQEEKDDRLKQFEMIIDMLDMKIRFYEGKLDKLSKKFFTIIKDQ